MKKINVLFLAEELRVGGAESYFYKIENNIDKTKFNFYCMAVNGKQISNLKTPINYYSYKFSPIDRVKKIKQKCLEKNIEVIHANSLQLAFCAVFVKKQLKKKHKLKIMYTKHNLTILEKISKKLFAVFLNFNIDIINPICNVEKDYLIDIGVNENKIKTIYNGTKIDDFIFNKKRGKKNIYSIGILARLSIEKRHDIFVNIAKDVLEKNENVKFYIGGDGPEKESIEKLIISNKLENKVNMLGNVNASDFLDNIDYLLLVSDREVLPMSIIEGMASGCIVVARNVGGIKELVTDKTGYLIDGENPSDYTNIILNLISKNFDSEKSLNARKLVEDKFSLKNMLKNIEIQYEELFKN